VSDEVHLLLAGLVFVLVGLGSFLRSRREAASVETRGSRSPAAEDPNVAPRFQRRRRGCLWTCGLVAPPALFLMFADTERFLVPSFVALVALFALSLIAIRCPACGEPPTSGGDGIEIDPEKRPRCGARLK